MSKAPSELPLEIATVSRSHLLSALESVRGCLKTTSMLWMHTLDFPCSPELWCLTGRRPRLTPFADSADEVGSRSCFCESTNDMNAGLEGEADTFLLWLRYPRRSRS